MIWIGCEISLLHYVRSVFVYATKTSVVIVTVGVGRLKLTLSDVLYSDGNLIIIRTIVYILFQCSILVLLDCARL